jgi:intraflagellar transport protein 46
MIDTKIKPFIPDYIPAIGEVDAFLKINRPDNLPDEIGLNFIDEPTIQGIDPTIFAMEMSYIMKLKPPTNMHIKSIENAEKNPKLIQNWITQLSDLHKEKMSSSVNYNKKMPDIESLMQVIYSYSRSGLRKLNQL